jgi:hypothetical protein
MTSQLVAFATQSRNASGLDALEELDELEEDVPLGHRSLRASRQLVLFRELLELDDEDVPGKHVLHLAMMLSTALSHLDDDDGSDESPGQPVQPAMSNTENTERANPRKARFMSSLPESVKEF